jgi:hypothetical protein
MYSPDTVVHADRKLGWECPRCHAMLSPLVSVCSLCLENRKAESEDSNDDKIILTEG